MQSVLKNTYDYFEKFTGRRLIALLLGIFIAFVLVGVFAGQISLWLSGGGEKPIETNPKPIENQGPQVVEKLGKVVYSDPSLFPSDGISYKLIDSSGKLIIYLQASDDKLKVVEGANVRVRGKIKRTSDGKNDILFVDQIVFK